MLALLLVALDLAAPWPTVTIAAPDATRVGADGIAIADLNADGIPDIAAAWEQTGGTGNTGAVTITISTGPAAWSTTTIGGMPQAEDIAWGDVTGDGLLDLVVATEDKRIWIVAAPGWTKTAIATATNVQRWMQVRACDLDGDGDTDIVAGGRTPWDLKLGKLGWFEAPAWTWHPIAPAGWTMTVECRDLDGDGDLDVASSDRLYYLAADGVTRLRERMGSSWYEQVAAGATAFAWHHVGRAELGEPKFSHFAPGLVFDGSSRDAQNGNSQESWIALRFSADGFLWGSAAIPVPANVGQYHDIEPADLDGDGQLDLIVSFSNAPGDLSGLVVLLGPTWERWEVSGPDGTKFDNVLHADVDLDGDEDVITSEQLVLGVVAKLNPVIP